ncbi:streptomycin 6-kinase [Brevibacterium paucivorans]|uniref:Streptomycin 6-kinase n=1 Tax=Brevibacterium paucivorans TaxID=170994 RepID=A0ABS2SLG3_9MICO|nr:streptomycin 6-kinase [Brevibacterium paucivorans]MCG7298709.1 aminoglycoside phosphotransferase family protein [Brevibacterium sp. ACRRH]
MQVPKSLLGAVGELIGPERADAWAKALPFMFNELCDRWSLTPDPVPGSPWAGAESLVVPVLTKENYQAIVRFASPNSANPHVHAQVLEALRAWNGRGAVRIIEEDSSFRATLQERLVTAENLSTVPLDQVPPIWGQLVRVLTVHGGRGFVRVQDIAQGWLNKFNSNVQALADYRSFRPEDRQVIDQAHMWTTRLAQSQQSYLLHADLHYYNILAGHPDSNGISTWKAIDPQPLLGPVAYMVAPMLWNRLYEIPTPDPAQQAKWLYDFAVSLCQHAGIDPQFGLGASIAREVANMFWYLKSARGGTQKAYGDADRSLWVARALAGMGSYGVNAHNLKKLG